MLQTGRSADQRIGPEPLGPPPEPLYRANGQYPPGRARRNQGDNVSKRLGGVNALQGGGSSHSFEGWEGYPSPTTRDGRLVLRSLRSRLTPGGIVPALPNRAISASQGRAASQRNVGGPPDIGREPGGKPSRKGRRGRRPHLETARRRERQSASQIKLDMGVWAAVVY